MFKPEEKSTFKYWAAHLFSYNMVALNLRCWKFKYLFHDFEKPWLKLMWGDYSKVRAWHRNNNRHHLGYKDPSKIDWEALVIDWECCRFTKEDAPLNARETYNYTITTRAERGDFSPQLVQLMKENIPPILDKLGL